MRRKTTEAVLCNDIPCAIHDRHAIVAIVTIISIKGDVLSRQVESVRVVRETLRTW